MTDTSIAQTEPVLVAIDISKARHEVLIAVPGKTRRRRLTVLNQLDDFNRLIASLAEYGRPEGSPVAEISPATYFNWKKKYAGLLATEMKRLKQLDDENARLKKIVADQTLDREMLQDVMACALIPSSRLSTTSETSDHCIAALTACVAAAQL